METLRTYLKANRGMQSKLARHLGIWPSTVNQWHNVPSVYVRKVHELTGIPLVDLRPDLYAGLPA